MTEFDWVKALDCAAAGHTLKGIGKVRDLADLFGAPQPPMHPLERERVRSLRSSVESYLAEADIIEARSRRAES
jgi:hypothetical protein